MTFYLHKAKRRNRHDPTPMNEKRRRRLLRFRMFHAQYSRCYWCAEVMITDPALGNDDRYFTFDHIKLHADGGEYVRANGVIACRRCNFERGDIAFDEFCEMLGVTSDIAERCEQFRKM